MLDAELRRCVEHVVGEAPPDDVEPRLWLAERNLGLVPIDRPAEFSWAGPWLARLGGHAVVMFGSPSGVLFDPSGAATGAVEEGWLVAPLDVHLPIGRPDRASGAGVVAAILLAADAEAPTTRVDEADAVPGRGLAGDRYAEGRGTFGPGRGYELTLVDADALAGAGVAWEESRRNLVTRGVDLNALVGRRFRVGEVECAGRRLAEPCAHLERLTRRGIMRPLVHRAGLRADILAGGTIRVGDPVEPR